MLNFIKGLFGANDRDPVVLRKKLSAKIDDFENDIRILFGNKLGLDEDLCRLKAQIELIRKLAK